MLEKAKPYAKDPKLASHQFAGRILGASKTNFLAELSNACAKSDWGPTK